MDDREDCDRNTLHAGSPICQGAVLVPAQLGGIKPDAEVLHDYECEHGIDILLFRQEVCHEFVTVMILFSPHNNHEFFKIPKVVLPKPIHTLATVEGSQ